MLSATRFLAALVAALPLAFAHTQLVPASAQGQIINDVPSAVRDHWMRVANEAPGHLLGDPCGLRPFGTAIVNRTDNTLVALGANNGTLTGSGIQHGEINGIQRTVDVLTERGLSPSEIRAAFRTFSLYTNGEPCPMCASAIRWSGFSEVIFGTSIEQLVEYGVGQILVSSFDIFSASYQLGSPITILPTVLTNETDPLFAWQYNATAPCPAGCSRVKTTSDLYGEGTTCKATASFRVQGEL